MLEFIGDKFHIYGLLIGLSIWLALEVSLRVAKRLEVEKKLIDEALLWVIIPGLIGARIYHVIDLWNEVYSRELIKVLYLWEGGLGIWGGILGGALGLWLFWKVKRMKISFLRLTDVFVVGVPLAQTIGRWGNFANGELYGKPTTLPWGIYVDKISTRVHPLFLYESVLDLILFVLLFSLVKMKGRKNGVIFGTYLIGYGLIRLLLETLRPTNVVWVWNGVPVAQMFAGLAILVGVFLTKKLP